RKFLTEDPGFGWVNLDGNVADILDPSAVAAVGDEIREAKQRGDTVVLIGNGACLPQLREQIDTLVYAEMTVEPMMWQMWDGKLKPFGRREAKSDYWWKEYYYCDFYLLHRQRKYIQGEMDYFLQAIELDDLKLVTRSAFDEILETLSKQPIKEIKIFSPGPWGAYRFKDYFEVPGLGCNAWNRLASPDLAMLIDLGDDIRIEMQFLELMRHQSQIVGERIARNHPDLFPVEIFLDDGYFPEPQPAEWAGMPMHNHYIPPGITHGHGGNQMVLEMDTCPSISATEYSFFGYDFVRKTWDDQSKTMSGPPMKMHMEHYVDNERGYRREYVDKHLRPRPKVFSFHKQYWLDRYEAPPSIPFLVERLHFKGSGAYDTEGRFMHVATLTVGKRVTIRSKTDPSRSCELDFLQSAIIPAGFGAYTVENEDLL
ncbi:MAG: hypothetical protein ACOCWS_02650, partial [Alkalispirochaetaceae bacterium]